MEMVATFLELKSVLEVVGPLDSALLVVIGTGPRHVLGPVDVVVDTLMSAVVPKDRDFLGNGRRRRGESSQDTGP